MDKEEVRKPEATEEAKAVENENKEAQGQGMYHLYCEKCGYTWWSNSWDNYCQRWGCTGRARRM